MSITLSKSTKYILTLVMLLSLAFAGLSMTAKQPQADIGDVNVTIGTDGKLNVSGGGMNYVNSSSAMNAFIQKYKTIIVGISGLGAVSMIAFFIFNFLKLGSVATNPSERSKVLTGLIWSGLAAAGLGAVSTIVGFFYNSMK